MQLLKLRYFQLKRDLGYWVLIIAAVALYFSCNLNELKDPYPLVIPGVVILCLFNYHVYRADMNFIRKYLGDAKRQVLLNYNMLILPLSLGMIVSAGWTWFVLMHATVSLIATVEVRFNGMKLLFISRYIPPSQFEWISGLRTGFFMIIILLILALVLSPVKLFALVAIFLADTIFLSFYNFYEPLIMLNARQLDRNSFLKEKINYFVKMLLLTNVPVLLLNSIFHPDMLVVNFFFLMAIVLLATCTVYIKYASYKPNEQQGFNADFLVLFAAIFIPYLLPLSVLIFYNNKRKARINLANYLDDHS